MARGGERHLGREEVPEPPEEDTQQHARRAQRLTLKGDEGDAAAAEAGKAMASDRGATSASHLSLLSRSDPRSFWNRVPDSLGLEGEEGGRASR